MLFYCIDGFDIALQWYLRSKALFLYLKTTSVSPLMLPSILYFQTKHVPADEKNTRIRTRFLTCLYLFNFLIITILKNTIQGHS